MMAMPELNRNAIGPIVRDRWRDQLQFRHIQETSQASSSRSVNVDSGTSPSPAYLLNIDCLLQIFRFLPLNDCFNCSQVCRYWQIAASQHFRIQKQLTFTYNETVHYVPPDERFVFQSVPQRRKGCIPLNTIQNSILLSYPDFVRILSQFPSVQSLTLRKHPVNDTLLSVIAILFPKLKEVNLSSCWIHSSLLEEHSVYYRKRSSPFSAFFSQICPSHVAHGQPPNEYRYWSDYLLKILESRYDSNEIASSKWLDTVKCNIEQIGYSCVGFDSSAQSHQFRLYSASQLSLSGFEILAGAYQMVTHLTLANCGLTDDTAAIVIQNLKQIKYLDISENEEVEGRCLKLLPETCQTFKAGTFNTRVSIMEFMADIVRSPAKSNLINLELIGCLFENLHHLEQMTQLEELTLRFFCSNPMVRTIAPFVSIASLTRLKTLVLEQQFSHQEISVIGHSSFCDIVSHCTRLEQLEILGEYGWDLRLNDRSLQALANDGHNLRRLTLTGNSSKITNKGIEWLARMSQLRQLRLTSFESITDKSIVNLLFKLKHLNRLCLRGNRRLTVKTMDACVQSSYENPERFLEVKFNEWQMSASRLFLKYASNYIRNTWCNRIELLIDRWSSDSNNVNNDDDNNNNDETNENENGQSVKRVKLSSAGGFSTGRSGFGYQKNNNNTNSLKEWPKNLNIILDRNLRQYHYDGNDLTPGKLLIVFLSSVIVLTMMVATLGVVIILPAGMTILLLYEKFIYSFMLILAPSDTAD